MIKVLTNEMDTTRQSILPLLLVAAFSIPTTTTAQDVNNADDVLFVSDSVTDAINIPDVLSGGSDEEDHSSILGAKYRPASDRASDDPIYQNVTIIRNDYAVTGGTFGEAEGTNLTLLGDLFPYCSVFWSASGPHEPLGLFPDRISNGSFENISGTYPVLSGWRVDSPVDWDFDFSTPPSNGASSGAGFVDLTPSGQISQVLTTEAGQTYMLSIDRKGDGSIVSLNGSYLLLMAGKTSGDWTTYTSMFTAPTAMTSLVISGTSADLNGVDNVRFAPHPQTPGLGADGGLHIDADVMANLDYYVRNGGFLFVTGHDAITHPPSAPAVSDGPLVKLLGGAFAFAGQEVDPFLPMVSGAATPVTLPPISGTPSAGGINQVDGVREQDFLAGYDAATTPLVIGPRGAYWTVRSPYGDGVDDDGTVDGVDLTDGHIAYVANGVFFYDTDPVDEFGMTIDTPPLSDGEDPSWRTPPYNAALLNFATNSCFSAASAETPTAYDQAVSTFVDTPVDIVLTGFDPNGDSLSYAIATGPFPGMLSPLVDDSVTYTPDIDFTGSDSFTFTANDGTNTSPPATVSIEVLPIPPLTVDAGPDVSIDEGSGDSFASAGSFTDPDPSGAPWEARVDYGDGGGTVLLALEGQNFSLANAYSTDDDAIFLVTVTVTDTGDFDFDSDTAVVFINNVPPSVGAGPDDTISEGETFVSLGSFTDPGPLDTHSATVDYGDGSGPQPLTILAGNAFELSHTYSTADPDPYTVTVTVTDDDGGVGVDTAEVTVVENVAPAVAADNATVILDEGLTASNSGTFSDANGDAVSVTASIGNVTQVGTSSGTWSWSWSTTDGPDDSQTVTITADDGEGGVTTTTFSLVVNNVAPTVAADISPVTADEGSVAGNTGTFADAGADIVTVTASVGVASQVGTQSGTWSWAFGTTDGPEDSQVVTITATDSDGAFSYTTFDLIVLNVPPVANDDAYGTNEDTPLVVPADGVLANDTDVGVDSLTASVTTDPSNGTLSLNGDGSFTFTPDLNWFGTDTFVYTATDDDGATDTATVTITVAPVNDPPIANSDSVTAEGVTATPVTLSGSDPDGDALTFAVVSGPANGILMGVAPDLTYTSDPEFLGSDSFTFLANDGELDSAPATVAITVVDTTPPVLAVPPDLTVEANAFLSTVDIGTATASDFFPVTITNNAPAAFPLGTTVVSWTATDSSGNEASADQTVTIVDTTPPVLMVPADLTVEANGVLSTVELGDAVATDIFSVVVSNDAPAAGFRLGLTVVTWTATDANGNTTVDTQNVTVVDTTPPELSVPADVTVEATGPQTDVDIGMATATDIFPVTITNDAPASYPLGMTEVTWTATDANGNSSSTIQRVTVVDTMPPDVTAVLERVGGGDDDDDDDEGRFRVVVSATDRVDPAPAITAELVVGSRIIPVTEGQMIEYERDDEDAEFEYDGSVIEIEAPTLILRVTATDFSGNTAVAEAEPMGLAPDDDSEDEDDD